MLGFAQLKRPAGRVRLNYEDHDLLKTVGRQMAVFITQERARPAGRDAAVRGLQPDDGIPDA
jgi:hypothetical protein